MMDDEFVREELIRAIQAEKWGYEFYIEASRKAKDLNAKEVFLRMTQDEVQHQKILKEMISKIGEDWDIDNVSPEPLPGLKLPKIEEVKVSDFSDKEALEIAIKMENAVYNFYMELTNMVGGSEYRKFLKKLADFEKEHFVSLKNSYQEMTGKPYKQEKS